jgi:hypothetical protein
MQSLEQKNRGTCIFLQRVMHNTGSVAWKQRESTNLRLWISVDHGQ